MQKNKKEIQKMIDSADRMEKDFTIILKSQKTINDKLPGLLKRLSKRIPMRSGGKVRRISYGKRSK